MTDPQPGPGNDVFDVAGLLVGHHSRVGDGFLSGTSVLLAPEGGMVAGVDVRGGAPGTRETDLLNPVAAIQRVHALVLTGGSAYGLSAACGVADALGARGVGFPVGVGDDAGDVVPIVPAAVLFDLGRGGDFRARPGAEFGTRAVANAGTGFDRRLGAVGVGTGAVTSGLKGGVGMASLVLPGGVTVAALVVANAAGSPVDPRTGELLGARNLLSGDVADLRAPSAADRDAVLAVIRAQDPHLRVPANSTRTISDTTLSNTTLGVVITDATLTKAECAKFAGTAHDGLARALNPVHTAFDGDTLFGVSTAVRPAPDALGLHDILCAAADVVTRALVRGLVAATSVRTPAGHWYSYRDLAPSAFAG